MLCDNCPALRSEGYEYPEEYCLIQPEDNILEFKGGCGCRLRIETIKRKVQEAEDAYCKECEDMAEWYVLTEEIEKVPEQKAKCLSLMEHSIGYDRQKGHTYQRHGKKFFLAWRNYFATTRATNDFPALRQMCSAGLMECDKPLDYLHEDKKEMLYFSLTQKGFEWFGKEKGIIVKE